ncbi:MAG: hypothetical protein A2378_01510 [Candidatus Pacebacteria bacterium RIFOXYB1_FULL_44_10]|nr:MAG: hypothetical protein A2378_01510 [Candidatus Pacebacteria bacterium RIFOXYB1_FULL_44_10]HAX01316.1 penicillin-binding protein [Candidatus Paceibacterota bacterium]
MFQKKHPFSFWKLVSHVIFFIPKKIGRPLYYLLAFSALFFAILISFVFEFIQDKLDPVIRSIKKQFFHQKKKRQPRKKRVQKEQRLDYKSTFRAVFAPFISGALITMLLFGSGYGVYAYVFQDLPSPRSLLDREPPLTTKIYDRNGVLLYKMYKDENRTLVPLNKVPEQVKQAFIAIEDKSFYSHHGFSLRGIARATLSNAKGERVEGGSTITQQLVKNTLLSPEKTIRRKVRELVLSVMVEASISKDQILEMYFNEVSFGGTLYGVEEASRTYFGKSISEVSLAEGAFLAGLPQAPSSYSPFGPTPEKGINRQYQVLQRMVEDGYISQEQADQAKNEQLTFIPERTEIKAPHFVMYIRELLAQEYGEDILSQGGLEVVTTLDMKTQELAEKAIRDELLKLKNARVSNGASIVTNPQTGEILAMVGSRDYFDIANDGQVNVTIRERQPGSSIKPLTYAVAFSKGMTPSTMIEDSAVTFTFAGTQPYSPKNYDGAYHGKVSLRTALANSYNIPAVKLLAQVGIRDMIEQGRKMGISSWGEDQVSRFGLSLTLGGGEVKMIDMAKLYGTFANQGVTVELQPIQKISNTKGEVIYQNPCTSTNTVSNEKQSCDKKKTLDPRVAWQITSILSDNIARSSAFGRNSVLEIPKQQVAVKTGTTNSLRDNWTAGYTSDRVVVTWVGNNDNTPMSRVASGITGASPIWNTIMRTQLDEATPHVFETPEGFVKVKICAQTGTLTCSACPRTIEESFIAGTEPKRACTESMFTPPSPSPSPNPQSP